MIFKVGDTVRLTMAIMRPAAYFAKGSIGYIKNVTPSLDLAQVIIDGIDFWAKTTYLEVTEKPRQGHPYTKIFSNEF